MITTKQRNWIVAAVLILALDAIITIWGATTYNAVFFEANPLLASFKTIGAVTNAILVSKTIAAVAIIASTAWCNRNIGIEWGDHIAQGSVAVMCVWIAALAWINIWVNFL